MRTLPLGVVVLVVVWLGGVEAVGVDDIRIGEYNDYVVLVSDVQEYYQASSVFLIYAGNDESIHTTTLMVHLTREFSGKFVLSLTINYTDLTYHYDYYRGRIIRPLFVVLLSSPREVDIFQSVTREFDMSYPLWLIIFTEPMPGLCSPPSRGNLFNVNFDTEMMVKCHGDPNLREWYSIVEDSTELNELATWDPAERFRLRTNKSLFERRHTLAMRQLRIVTIRESPFISGEQGAMAGLFATILNELSNTLNFTVRIVTKDDLYGMYNETEGRWTGAIGRLEANEVDLGVAEFTMTGQRLNVVDFTQPIMLSRNHIYIKQPDGTALQWSAYFRVYTIDVWVMIEVMYALSSLIISYMRVTIKEKPIPPNHISENYLFVWGIYCQQGLPDFPTASPMRIAYFSVLVTAVILLAIYSACLISYLTVTSPSLPFTNLNEFAQDGSYMLIAFQQSADYDLLASSTDIVLRKMMKLMREEKYLPKTMMNGFQQACNNKIGFYATEAVKTQIGSRIPCDLVYLESGRIDSLAMILTRRSQYTRVINHHLQKFNDVGIMKRLRSKVYMKVSPSDNKYNAVNVGGIVTILLILCTGAVLSIFILACEIFAHRARRRREERRVFDACMSRIVVTKNTRLSGERRLALMY